MEPRIQYAKTSDGVSIAYTVLGNGPTIVRTTAGFGALHLYSSRMPPVAAQNTDALIRLGWRVIIYDGRGMGSSERHNTDFSLEARLRDLEAVIGQADLDHFVLQGAVGGGPAAIAYAAKHPERVSRLVLFATFANGSDYYNQIPAGQATRAVDTMAEQQWEFYTLAYANAAIGFADSEIANRFAVVMRSGMSARAYLRHMAAYEKADVTDLLPLVNVPTLVVHSEQQSLSNIDLPRVLASRIPRARLVRLKATEELARTIDAFLREGEERIPASPELPSGMTAILFTDIAASTALTERLGDAAFRAKARELGASLRALVRECAGTPVCPCTSASTPVTLRARRTQTGAITYTAAPSTSPRGSAGCPRPERCSCRRRCGRWRARRRGCGSRTAGSRT